MVIVPIKIIIVSKLLPSHDNLHTQNFPQSLSSFLKQTQLSRSLASDLMLFLVLRYVPSSSLGLFNHQI